MVGAHQVNLIRGRGRDRFLDILWLARGHTPLASGVLTFNKTGDLACESISQSRLNTAFYFQERDGRAGLFNRWALEFSAETRWRTWAEGGRVDRRPTCYMMVWDGWMGLLGVDARKGRNAL